MKRTVAALVARGADTETASRLAAGGWTVGKLRVATAEQLNALGLSDELKSQLLKGGRPPIPIDNAMRVLHRNRFQCCVCRDPSKPIILHHLDPWVMSHDHSDNNLAVLCLDHHERAHSVSALAKNLDAKTLRSLKLQWEVACVEEDRLSIIQASRLDYDAWLYFNHFRLFELAKQLRISLTKLEGFTAAKTQGLADASGNLCSRKSTYSYMYDDVLGMTLYHYVRAVLEAVIERITVINFSDLLDRGTAHQLLATGDFAIVQGAHTFASRTDKKKTGKGDVMFGTRRANNVEFRFTFDRWEATSCSAWATWLSGRQSVASLVQVKDVLREGGDAIVAATVIAISNGHHSLQQRNYSPRYGRYIFYDANDDEEGDDDWDW
ncbi:HNH endonuclease [Agrobacterium tumefaciens]|uniref:HNH endonuclease n=1 Tax=Agrobacterium tumefaciens TaxID=358 RepID=UPI003B9DCBBB